jgi:undecaprenyl-diphosphatase
VGAWFFAEGWKIFFPMPRPFVMLEIAPLVPVADHLGAFPSTHAAVFAALGVTMFFCNRKIGKWFLCGAFLVALARVGAGVHWPIDVLVGFLLGITVAILSEKFLFFFRKGSVAAC